MQLYQKNKHLLWRAGFGVSPHLLNIIQQKTPEQIYHQLERESAKTPIYLDVADNFIKGLFSGVKDIAKMQQLQKNGLDNDTKKKLREQSREDLKNLNLQWLDLMSSGEGALREKMALFWHGHFACRDINIYFQQKLLHEIRTHALGNFGELLKAVSKSASMLGFLNNQQNRKEHPNENFAREVMELFTLGRGHYTEKDIKEAARAFTGWGFNFNGEFVFRRFQHDGGSKTIFGKSGNFDGDDVLNMLLENPRTAYYITQKIYSYFVNDNVDEKRVQELAQYFYQSNYHIGSLMKKIFLSDWFYDTKNIGKKIKSPVELLVGLRQGLPLEIKNPEIQLLLQRSLGQLLFYPPNVAGWPGGTNWIDSSSLLIRMQIPNLLNKGDEFSLSAKTDDDQEMGMQEKPFKRFVEQRAMQAATKKLRIDCTIQWESYCAKFQNIKREELLNNLMEFHLQKQSKALKNSIEQFVDTSSKTAFIQSATIAIMSTPDYQLC